MSTAIETIPDQELREALIAAVRHYAARAETDARSIPLIERHSITATEAVLTVCELMHAADLNPFDVAMWYRRELPEYTGEAR
jgi:hypothetical protein